MLQNLHPSIITRSFKITVFETCSVHSVSNQHNHSLIITVVALVQMTDC